MAANTTPLDAIDRQILAHLQQDGRLSMVDLAARIGLTKTPCIERVKRLERAGVIRGYHAEVDPVALGAGHVVMVEVLLNNTTAAVLREFNAAVLKIPQVQSCHLIAGDFDYLLKVRTRDITEYRHLMSEVISELPCVKQTHTYVVMETIRDDLCVAIGHPL